jgi:hypothetical protein
MRSMDTTPEAEQIQLDIWRNMPDEKKLRLVLDMSDFVQSLSMSRIQNEHPEWPKPAVVREFIREQYPEQWAKMK